VDEGTPVKLLQTHTVINIERDQKSSASKTANEKLKFTTTSTVGGLASFFQLHCYLKSTNHGKKD